MQKSAPSRFGIISIISTVVILILILALAILSFLVEPVESEVIQAEIPTVDTINSGEVDAALAIALLAGVSPEDMIRQSIIKLRPGTALATVVSSPSLDAKEMAGDLVLIGDKFIEQDNKPYATLSFHLASTVATLSPDFSDTLRADIFLQAGIGLTAADNPILAKVYLDQAFLVVTESNHLQAAYRIAILESLNTAYLALDLNDEARRSLQASLDVPNLSIRPETPLVLPSIEGIALPTNVQQAESDRWRAAQFVARELVELAGTIRPDTLDRLRLALLAEDEAKRQHFAEALVNEPALLGKINIISAQINWQSLKYRVAQKGFGISLVPEWEADRDQISADLSVSYQALYQFYTDVIIAMPNASDIDLATEEALRRQMMAGTLGHYPGYPADTLRQSLLEASARLIDTQPMTDLRVSYVSINRDNYYILIRDEDVVRQ
ncbi:MAG: hypothetical protein AAF629_02960 [Chloroflexota bacterium]